MNEPILLYTIIVEEYTSREKPDSEGCYHIANSKVYPVPRCQQNHRVLWQAEPVTSVPEQLQGCFLGG